MSDDGSTRTGFGVGYGSEQTQTVSSRKLQVRMPSGKIYGPYTRIEVLSFIGERRVQGEEFILVEGETNWRPITSDNEFFDALQAILLGKKSEPTKKSGFTEEKARTAAPQKSRVQDPRTTPRTPTKTDTRLTNFSDKSDLSTPQNVKMATVSGVEQPQAQGATNATRSGVTKKIETNTQTSWANITPPLPGNGPAAPLTPPVKKRSPLVTVIVVAAVLGGGFLYLQSQKPNLNAPRIFGQFAGKTWYSRPLQLVMEGLEIKASPMPQVIEASTDWGLPEDFGAQAWADDLKKLNAPSAVVTDPKAPKKPTENIQKISAAYWGRWAWDTIWLGSILRVFDKTLGNALFKDGLQIYQELERRKLVPQNYQTLFEGATLFIEGKFRDSAGKFATITDIELGQWLAEEAAWEAFWQAGARGQGFRRMRDEYSSPVMDLSSKVRAAFVTREANDFNESLLQLANQAPLLNTLWFGAAEGQWRLRKEGATYANKMFLTGLGAVALNPGSVQEVYWNQFAEFLGVYGRQATSQRAVANSNVIHGGDLERVAEKGGWWDLNAAELDVSSLAEEVLHQSGRAMLNSRDMATLYVLGFVAPNGSKYLTVAGEHWAFEGKWLKAAQLFEKINKIDPKNAEALGGVVWANANLYRFSQAFAAHEKFHNTDAKTPEDLKYLGVIQSVGREYQNAETSFAQYIKSVPNDGFVHYFMAQNYLAQDRNVDCVKSANLSRIHSTGELRLRGDLLFFHCRILAKMDVKGALSELEQMTKNDPDSIPIALEYIQALRNADLSDRAIDYNKQMLVKYSRSFELRLMLGQLYESRSDFDRAVAFYSRARADQPESAEPVVRIGKIFDMQHKYKQAAQNFETASNIQPDYPEVWLLAARAYRKAKEPGVAAGMYFKEIEARPSVISTFIEASEFFLEAGSPQEVPKLFQKFEDDFQDDPRVKTRLAQAYLALNDLDKAQEAAAAAVAANNKIPEAYRVLGYVLDQQGQYDEAQKYFETYLQLLPQAADAGEVRQKISNPPYRR